MEKPIILKSSKKIASQGNLLTSDYLVEPIQEVPEWNALSAGNLDMNINI